MKMDTIEKLFIGIQSIKKRYPMVVSALKHIEKIKQDTASSTHEEDNFRKWLLLNPRVLDRELSEYIYKSKNTICFENVLKYGTTEVIAEFWNNLSACEFTLFPSGRPTPQTVSNDSTSAALSALESNPLFSDVLSDVKSTVANVDPNNIGSIVNTPEFGKLVKNIKKGLSSGKYQLSDLTSTLSSVVGSVQSELDPDTLSVVNSAVNMMVAAERGEQPDINKLLDLAKNIKM
jgi:hypothetical protein